MIHESVFDMGFFFLYISSLRLMGLVHGGGPLPLGCFLTLSESCFSLD